MVTCGLLLSVNPRFICSDAEINRSTVIDVSMTLQMSYDRLCLGIIIISSALLR